MRSALLLPLLVLVGGCWAFMPKDEGEKMRTELGQLKTKVDAIENREMDLNQATRDAKEQVTKLKGVLEEATRVVTRNSADVGLQVQKLQQDLALLTGKVDEIGHSLDGIQKDYQSWRAQADVKMEALGTKGGSATATPVDKDALFMQAQSKLSSGDHEEARRLLRQFITQYPQDTRVAQAQYLHGESYFQQKKYAAAITEYQKVLDNYAKAPAAQDAMYKMGVSFLELRFCTEARTFMSETLKRFPKTQRAGDIRATLAKIQKNAKNRKVCEPGTP